MKRPVYFALLALLFLSSGRAEPLDKPKSQPAPPAEKAVVAGEKWTVDDVINAEWASGFRLSPDGRHAVWVKTSEDRPAVWGWARWDFDRHQSDLQAQGYDLVQINAFVLS